MDNWALIPQLAGAVNWLDNIQPVIITLLSNDFRSWSSPAQSYNDSFSSQGGNRNIICVSSQLQLCLIVICNIVGVPPPSISSPVSCSTPVLAGTHPPPTAHLKYIHTLENSILLLSIVRHSSHVPLFSCLLCSRCYFCEISSLSSLLSLNLILQNLE